MTSSATILNNSQLTNKMFTDDESVLNIVENATEKKMEENNCPHKINVINDNEKILNKDSSQNNDPKSNDYLCNKKCYMKSEHNNQSRPHKRRYTFGGSGEYKPNYKRRKRFCQIALPTKFLLGGNIHDPLNLSSLENEEVNKKVNEVTPYSSPIPTPKHRTQVEVLIPTNLNDPLNLNSGEEIEFNSHSPKKKKKNKSSKKEKLDDSTEKGDHISLGEVSVKLAEKVFDKIVSPVVPQGSPTKQFRRFNKSLSCEPPEDKFGSSKRARRPSKPSSTSIKPRFNPKWERYQYGTHPKHLKDITLDPRIKLLKPEWFQNKRVLDIGCNTGFISLHIAQHFRPTHILGIDIDAGIIQQASKNIPRYVSENLNQVENFPATFRKIFGPSICSLLDHSKKSSGFPNNVRFLQADYIPWEEQELEKTPEAQYDTIVCLQVTKWIHLTAGDEGLKRSFRKMYRQLKPGGILLLEAQGWPAYTSAMKLTEKLYQAYQNINFRPEQFNEFLLSPEVGFSSHTVIGAPIHTSRKKYHRPIYLFTKSSSAPSSPAAAATIASSS